MTPPDLRAAQAEAGQVRRQVDPRPGREGVQAKGRRYLAEGRLQVLEVGPAIVRATCRGDGQVHRCGWWRGRWGCSCIAGTFGRACAHLVALRLVTTAPPRSLSGPRTIPGSPDTCSTPSGPQALAERPGRA